MRTNWTLVEGQDLKMKLSEKELEEFVENCQREIDRDILERYEWDWEFRKAVQMKVALEC